MSINIQLECAYNAYGMASAVLACATIFHSPSEGFDNEKLAELEKDLGEFITKRLNLAIKNGGAK